MYDYMKFLVSPGGGLSLFDVFVYWDYIYASLCVVADIPFQENVVRLSNQEGWNYKVLSPDEIMNKDDSIIKFQIYLNRSN